MPVETDWRRHQLKFHSKDIPAAMTAVDCGHAFEA